MPIPTDTLWNIRRLNLVFALSSVAMVAVCFWAVKQDYDKSWRPFQQSGRVWDAALTEERVAHLNTDEIKERVAQLNLQIDQKKQQLEQKDEEYRKYSAAVKKAESESSNIQFEYNNLKATVTVDETKLQDAKTRNQPDEVARITNGLIEPEKKLAAQGEELARLKDILVENRKAMKQKADELDTLQKQRKALYEEIETLRKREASLVPQTVLAKLSEAIRSAPLLQFMNPADKVRPIFLPDVRMDVSFMNIDTIDRCATCHVHIDNKNFSREKVYAYLEEELASKQIRDYKYLVPKDGKPDPSSIRPQATAMPEFWHYWGRKLLTPASLDKTKGKVNGIFAAIGKKIDVTYKGEKVKAIQYPATALSNPRALDPKEQARLDEILIAAINAVYRANPSDTGLASVRTLALGYPIQMQQLLKAELPAEQYRQLEERYRHEMIAEINPVRVKNHYRPLDPSSAQLAHPRLDLYVEQDSLHPMDSSGAKAGVGCTSCHDGSGNETDFVLAAHTPRSIWVDDKTGEPVLPAQLKKREQPAAHSEEHAAAHDAPTMGDMLAAVYPGNSVIPEVSSLHIELDKHGAHHEAAPAVGREHPKEEVSEHAPATEYVNPVNGDAGRAVPQARYWAEKYEPESGTSFEMVNEMWDWPMRPPEYLQANCARCHNNFHDIKDEAPILYAGRSMFNKFGCSNCHQMDSIAADEFEAKNILQDGSVDTVRRRAGTDLRHVPSKLSKEFVSTWIWAPKAFRPSTLMPHFFMLENNSSDEEIRRTRQEVKAITEYLFEAATPLQPKYQFPQGVSGAVEKGREIFQNIGCQGCHSNLNETGEEWITTDLVKRYGLKKADAQKKYEEMTYNQRQVYALENLGEVTAGNEQKKYADGSAMPVFMHHAPELSGIGDKLTTARTPEQAKAWLFDWLKEPRHYSAYTVMPRLRLSDQQAADLVEYLLAQKRGNTAPKGAGSGEFDGWQASEIKADQKKINELVSFFLRSQYSPLNSDKKAIDPKEMEARAIDALTFVSTATDEPRATDEDKAKEEAKTKAKARVAKMSLEQKQLVFLGSKLIAHYGCMNCHAINGMENAASPCANLSDWGQKQVSKLAFEYLDEHKIHSLPPKRAIPMVNGLSPAAVTQVAKIANDKEWSTPIAENVEAAWPQVEHTRTGWLTQKVLNSRVYDRGKNGLDPVRKMQNGKPVIDPQTKDPVLDTLADQELRGKPYDKLRMPTFYLNEEQAHAIVTFVISNRTRWISDKLLTTTNNEQSKRIAHGRQIAERYNCVGCHQVEANFPPVRQYYGKDVWATLTPPSLRGEGSKVQFDWLFNFLKNVELIRPNLFLRPQVEAKDGIRMPSFPVTDEETTALAAYFAAAANHESRELRQKLDNVIKYVDTQRKATTRPLPTTDKPWPGDDWIDKENFVQVRDELRQWVVSHELMLDSTFDPAKTKADEMKGKYREALYKARFILDLYDAPFPFVASAPMDQTDAKAADARFKKGEAFFTEMACLKCHYLGDLNASGGNNKPTAPNLALAHRRLQPRWLSRWVQEPPIIQVGTPMPPFFSGLSAFKLDGLPWPLGTASLQEDEDKLKQLGADADKVLAKYGTKDVRDQKTLLMDYLFTAGQKHGYTAMQPPDQATTAPATAQPSAPK